MKRLKRMFVTWCGEDTMRMFVSVRWKFFEIDSGSLYDINVCECSLEVVWEKTCLEEAYICVIAYCGFGVMFLASAALALLLSFFDCWLNVCCLRCRCALLSLDTPCLCLLAIRHLLIVAILSCRFSWLIGSLCRSHIRNAYPEKLDEESIWLMIKQPHSILSVNATLRISILAPSTDDVMNADSTNSAVCDIKKWISRLPLKNKSWS